MSFDSEETSKAISLAIETRDSAQCIELLESNRSFITGNWIDGNNLLYKAVAYGLFDVAKIMVRNFGADPNARIYDDGDTILTTCRDEESMKFVIDELGADPNHPADDDIFFDEAGNQYYETSLHIFLENKSFELIHALLNCISVLPPDIPGRGYLSFYVNPENPGDWPVIKKLCEKGAVDVDGLMLRRICLTKTTPQLLRICEFLCNQQASGQVYPSQFIDILLDETVQAQNYAYIPRLYRLTSRRLDAKDPMPMVLLGRIDLIPYIDTSQKFMMGKCIAKAIECRNADMLSALLQKTGLGLEGADFRHVIHGLLREEWAETACEIALEQGDFAIGMYVLSRPENNLSSVSIARMINNDPNVELEKIEAMLATSLKNEKFQDAPHSTALPDITKVDIYFTQNRRDIFASLLKYDMIGPFSPVVNLPEGSVPTIHATTRGNADLVIAFNKEFAPMEFLEYLVKESQEFARVRELTSRFNLIQMVSSRVQPPPDVVRNENARITPDALQLVQNYLLLNQIHNV